MKALLLGAAEYDYLKNVEIKREGVESLLEELCRLVEYLVAEKRAAESKYEKLEQLHSGLIEATVRGSNGKKPSDSEAHRLADENEKLRVDLNILRADKLYYRQNNLALKESCRQTTTSCGNISGPPTRSRTGEPPPGS